MKIHIVNLSGGLTSAYAMDRTITKVGVEHTKPYFANTKGKKDRDNPHAGEDEDSYRFIRDLAKFYGITIIMVADGRDIWQVMKDKRAIKIPKQDYAPCSKALKTDLLDRVIGAKYKPSEIVRVFGMQWYETNRMYKLMQAIGSDVWFPLSEPPYLDKEEIRAYYQERGIAAPRLYDLGFEHNNCGGFCVRAGKAHFARLFYTMPERYLYHEQKEQEFIDHIGKRHTVLREKRNGVTITLTLREFRERLESGDHNYDPQDFGACGCFVGGIAEEKEVN